MGLFNKMNSTKEVQIISPSLQIFCKEIFKIGHHLVESKNVAFNGEEGQIRLEFDKSIHWCADLPMQVGRHISPWGEHGPSLCFGIKRLYKLVVGHKAVAGTVL